MSWAQSPRILVFVAYFWPGYKAGGPIRSATNFATTFASTHEIFVVTQDRDAREQEPYSIVPASRWVDFRGAKVWYLPPGTLRAWTMWILLRQTDPEIVILNSFFSTSFSLMPQLLAMALPADSRAVWLIHPRGEFAPSALASKPWRKKIWMYIWRLLGVMLNTQFQVSSEHEKSDLIAAIGIDPRRVHVAMNLANIGEDPRCTAAPSQSDPLRFVFLSRLSPVKNLELALRAVFKVSRPCSLDIYGPVSDHEYTEKCKKMAKLAPSHVTVRWHEQVPGDKVQEVLSTHHFLVLPTQGENFGHVIVESLSAGLPVIVSDRTPWRDLESFGAGWVRQIDTPGDFEDAVLAAARLTPLQWVDMSARARARAKEFIRSDAAFPANRDMLGRLISLVHSSKPYAT